MIKTERNLHEILVSNQRTWYFSHDVQTTVARPSKDTVMPPWSVASKKTERMVQLARFFEGASFGRLEA